jgi:hypothetical protein
MDLSCAEASETCARAITNERFRIWSPLECSSWNIQSWSEPILDSYPATTTHLPATTARSCSTARPGTTFSRGDTRPICPDTTARRRSSRTLPIPPGSSRKSNSDRSFLCSSTRRSMTPSRGRTTRAWVYAPRFGRKTSRKARPLPHGWKPVRYGQPSSRLGSRCPVRRLQGVRPGPRARHHGRAKLHGASGDQCARGLTSAVPEALEGLATQRAQQQRSPKIGDARLSILRHKRFSYLS